MGKRKKSDTSRHARTSGKRDRRTTGHNPLPAERESAQPEEPVEDDEELTSPAARGSAATTTPTTEWTNPLEHLLAAAAAAEQDPELLENMRTLKSNMAAKKREAEESRDYWHGQADAAREQLRDTAEELAKYKEAFGSALSKIRRQEGELFDIGEAAPERRRYRKGHRGSAWTRPLWMVQLVLEHLVAGIPPASIPAAIRSHAELTAKADEQIDVPSVDFCRRMRSVLRVLSETLAAYRLAKQARWKQLFTDGTGRRQIALQNLTRISSSPSRTTTTRWYRCCCRPRTCWRARARRRSAKRSLRCLSAQGSGSSGGRLSLRRGTPSTSTTFLRRARWTSASWASAEL
mmetsp:Transcript_47221/g.124471  ORF Transcript_47221/g.124471 Transcript_47221/m.124471 type:complete len:348 (-) Transcript_47221:164-1207(-)